MSSVKTVISALSLTRDQSAMPRAVFWYSSKIATLHCCVSDRLHQSSAEGNGSRSEDCRFASSLCSADVRNWSACDTKGAAGEQQVFFTTKKAAHEPCYR
jgi:hypothetical protein